MDDDGGRSNTNASISVSKEPEEKFVIPDQQFEENQYDMDEMLDEEHADAIQDAETTQIEDDNNDAIKENEENAMNFLQTNLQNYQKKIADAPASKDLDVYFKPPVEVRVIPFKHEVESELEFVDDTFLYYANKGTKPLQGLQMKDEYIKIPHNIYDIPPYVKKPSSSYGQRPALFQHRSVLKIKLVICIIVAICAIFLLMVLAYFLISYVLKDDKISV